MAALPEARGKAGEYAFLVGKLIDSATLERACRLAERWKAAPHEVLIANGWVCASDYYRALAGACGTGFVEPEQTGTLHPAPPAPGPRQCLRAGLLQRMRGGRRRLVLTPAAIRPLALQKTLLEKFGRNDVLDLATPAALREVVLRSFSRQFLRKSIHGLAERYPEECAAQGLSAGQRRALAAIAVVACAAAFLKPLAALQLLTAMASLFFFLVVCLRIAACVDLMAADARPARSRARIADGELPVYTILVPLYREHHMLPQIVAALARLDYPAPKLDIKLILESVDTRTLAAAAALRLPGNFEIIAVPDARPRTKPKALNHALQLARGEFAVIYDAEDRPPPDQLRVALAAFRAGPPNLACVQARLNVFNASENWLTGQFAIEYAALFDGLLPLLQRLGLPIPLGGTSNHFRTSALRWLGAWDAFNVTEDADLGMRLYRRGYVCRILPSTTLEEAPCRLGPWLRQRTRWLKGFMQTWLVHMRHPGKLWRELGPAGFLGFQTVIGGLVFSALLHPAFYLLVAVQIAAGVAFDLPAGLLGVHFWLVALFNVSLGYLASMALALLAVRRRKLPLARHVVFMPAYWLLVSASAYRALVHYVRAPFHWEKTEHGITALAAQARAKSARGGGGIGLS